MSFEPGGVDLAAWLWLGGCDEWHWQRENGESGRVGLGVGGSPRVLRGSDKTGGLLGVILRVSGIHFCRRGDVITIKR